MARPLIVACVDLALIWLAFCLAYYVRYELRWTPVERVTVPEPFRVWLPFGFVFAIAELTSLALAGGYRARLGRDLLEDTLVIVRSTLVGVGLIAIIVAFFPGLLLSRLVLAYAWAAVPVLLILVRVLLWATPLHRQMRRDCRVMVVGSTPIARMVLQHLLHKRRDGYLVVGFLREVGHGDDGGHFGRFSCLGSADDLPRLLIDRAVDEVIVALPAARHAMIAAICAQCEEHAVRVRLVPDLFELRLSQVRMDHLAGIPLIEVRHGQLGTIDRAAKRALDLAVAGLLLALLAPLMLATALAIKLDSPGPVFNNQRRVGRGGQAFTFHKFRSMHVGAEHQRAALAQQSGSTGHIFKDRCDPRRTRVGRIIRRLSLDELPQLVNVVRGDMSLVGPRPPLPAEVAHYAPHHLKRLEVLGGITGLWQVSGRSEITSFEEIVMMDTYYIDNWSFGLDLRILLRTILALVTRRGAY